MSNAPTQPMAGPAQSVVVVTDVEVEGSQAYPVYGWVGLPDDGRSVEGAPAQRVVVIGDSDLVQNGGKYQLVGMPFAIPVSGDATVPQTVEGNIAIAVYPVNSWPSSVPANALVDNSSIPLVDESGNNLIWG